MDYRDVWTTRTFGLLRQTDLTIFTPLGPTEFVCYDNVGLEQHIEQAHALIPNLWKLIRQFKKLEATAMHE